MIVKKLLKIVIVVGLLASAASIFYFNSRTIVFSSNFERGVNNFWRNTVSIKEVKDFEAYGKKFKLVLSTSLDNKKYKYLICYEEKMNGLYYKYYRASEQGGSNALFSFSNVIMSGSDKENYFTIVYGYNEDLQVASYEMKVSGQEKNMISNVSNKEYFIDAAKGDFQGIVKVIGKEGNDKNNVFND